MNFPGKIIIVMTVAMAGCQGAPSTPTSPAPPIVRPGPAPSPAIAHTARTRYLAFGDSITAGTTSPALTAWAPFSAGLPQSYPFKLQSLLAARYSEQPIEVSNQGLPGESAESGARRLGAVMRTVMPEVVILLHGVNDVTFQGIPGVRRTAEFVNTMAREARTLGAEVWICTLLPHRPGGFRAADPAVIAAYNVALRDVARGEGATLIDFEARGFELRLIGADGLHPTEDGYVRMADILFAEARAQYEVPR